MAMARKTAQYQWNFMRWRMPALAASLLVIMGSLVLFAVNGLNYGIDFAGGVVLEIHTEKEVPLSELRHVLGKAYPEVSLQAFGEGNVMIRLPNPEDGDAKAVVTGVKEVLATALEQPVEFRRAEYVGPQVGDELKRSGLLALMLSFVAMMVYIWFRFEWQYGLGGILALVHDAALTLGLFLVTGLEFNLTSVAALLTIVGYSINDSVVIYDRIRENLRRYKKMPLNDVINLSLNETLSRTMLTGGTTLIALVALVLFGGEAIFGFSLAVFFGVVVGTYSSIFISAPVLVYIGVNREEKAPAADGFNHINA